ncbi:putative C6 and C2H2 transcription factor [Lasiodiplodia theobromae]|nr:putative C6 and C2H2 transcription factor [Lasiodiplodia theobromae]
MPPAKFSCPHCECEYTRRDSLRRHIKLHHRDKDLKRLRALAACVNCKARKTKCEGSAPCDFCLERGLQCKYDNGGGGADQAQPEPATSSQTPIDCTNLWSPEIDQYVEAYFARFHPTWSFLHKATFSPRRELPFLVQAVVMIGLWATTQQSGAREAAIKLHEKMRVSIREQQKKWDVSGCKDDDPQLQEAWPIGTSQAILLFLVFTTMLETRQEAAAPSTQNDRDILIALVKSCRKRGMFSHENMITQFRAVGARPYHATLCAWVSVEEMKRFAAALYQVWRLYEQSGVLPEDEAELLEDEHLQFPMPDGEFLWDADSEADLLRRIGEEKSRGARPCEKEMQWLGTSWDDILTDYIRQREAAT